MWRTPEIWQAQTTFPKNASKYKRTVCNNQSERKRSSLFLFPTFANSALLSTQTDFDSTSSNNSSSSYSWNCWVMRRQGGLSKPIEHEMGSHFQVGHLFFFETMLGKFFDSMIQRLNYSNRRALAQSVFRSRVMCRHFDILHQPFIKATLWILGTLGEASGGYWGFLGCAEITCCECRGRHGQCVHALVWEGRHLGRNATSIGSRSFCQ